MVDIVNTVLNIAAAGTVIALVGGCVYSGIKDMPPSDQTVETFEEVSFDEMVDQHYAIDQVVKFEGSICYDGGWQGMLGEESLHLSIMFEDDLTGEAFFAYTTENSAKKEHSLADAALAAVNCDEDFAVYGKKTLDEQGNPELQIGALEFKLGPHRAKRIVLDDTYSPQEGD